MATDLHSAEPDPAQADAEQTAADAAEGLPAGEDLGPRPGRLSRLIGRIQDGIDSAQDLATPGNLKLAGFTTLGFLLLYAVIFFATREEGPTNAEKLLAALEFLNDGDDSRAARLAQELQQQGYQDPDFPGGDQFILGIVAFRQAEQLSEDEGREPKYLVAKSFLEEARERALTEEYEAQWAYALGLSLYRIGRAKAAQPLLEKAVDSYTPGKIESGLLLADTYVYSKTPDDLEKAHELNVTIAAMPDLTDQQRDRVYLQRAQILYAMDKVSDAEAALAEVHAETDGITVLRAEVLMKAGKYREALKKLRAVEAGEGLQQKFPRQARYLMGMCEQRLAQQDRANETVHFDAARNYYERTYKQFRGSHEAVAAQLWAADILRKQNFHEKALETYNDVLRQVQDPQEFSNKWIDVKVFRRVILDAWNSWNELHLHQHSIALADHMSPLFPPALSREYSALANQKAAQYLEDQLATVGSEQRQRRQAELQARWLRSGQAFALLASERKTSAEYPSDLWMAADHFMKGHDYESALNYLTLFIDTNPTTQLPAALVQKGTVLMQLDLFDDALKHFERVVANYPTDPIAFRAHLLIGTCYFQTDRHDQAEQTWRDMLISDRLTPAAEEWQQALFGLGKLLHLTSEETFSKAVEMEAKDPSAAAQLKYVAYRRWDEAIVRLDEFVKRFDIPPRATSDPRHRDRVRILMEARYYLAKACQRSAELQQTKMKAAETENARNQFFSQMKQLLDQSNSNYERLKMELLLASDEGRIDDLGREFLRNCYFEIPNNFFNFQDYHGAVIRYREAAGRYQDHPDALRAMVQEANCYDRLNRPLDARGALAQAKFILEQIPDQHFQGPDVAMSKEQWRDWLQWAIELHNRPAA